MSDAKQEAANERSRKVSRDRWEEQRHGVLFSDETEWRIGRASGDTWDRGIFCGCHAVAKVSGAGYPSGEGWHPESEANARLIAAAPELYRLALMVAEFDGPGGTTSPMGKAARDVLAKIRW